MTYDESKEETETDNHGNTIRLYYDGDLVWDEHYQCFKCGWTGDREEHGPDLNRCPECGEGKHHGGLQIEEYEDGAWRDAKNAGMGE